MKEIGQISVKNNQSSDFRNEPYLQAKQSRIVFEPNVQSSEANLDI